MIKHKVIVLGILVVLLGMPIISHAAFFQSFGGRIIQTKATEIQTLEATNYECTNPQGSIKIKPVGKSPVSYVTQFYNNTRTTPRSGQQVLGLYQRSGAFVACVFKGLPPNGVVLNLNQIMFDWGTSQH